MALLDVRNLEVAVISGGRLLPVVQDLSIAVEENETFGIVGESGCGKSLAALAIMGLLEDTQAVVTGGSIVFEGRELTRLPPAERRSIMGNRMAMIFQEPMTSLNPVYRVGEQISESLRQHRRLSKSEARERAAELLGLVRIPNPEQRVDYYPHQLSGGQRQRVMIAMALSCSPKLLIADEPTTALDVTVQSGVLDLIRDVQRRTGTAVILICHDLGVISETCDRVAVMYRGGVVEAAATEPLLSRVLHPYTSGLLSSIPPIDRDVEWLDAIPGRVPMIDEALEGCPFHPRCYRATEVCRRENPPSQVPVPGHAVRCHHPRGASA